MAEKLLLTNAHLLARPGLFSIAIHDGEITGITSRQETISCGEQTIDLEGACVLPGLWDAHLHLEMLTFRLSAIDCETDTKQACLEAVQKVARERNDNCWLIGFNWNHNIWQPAEYGTAQQLDLVSASHPVLLYAKSLHASWANSAALKLAGINENTPNPVGGEILRDNTGKPTGILLENAMRLVDQIIPPLDPRTLANHMRSTQNYLHGLGITGVHDFDRFESYEALRLLSEQGERTLEVVKNLPVEALDQIISHDFRADMRQMGIIPGWVKGFADGALGSQSAAMVEPYENSSNRGMLLLHPEEILEFGLKATQAGWPMAIHAIGDAANQAVMDGYALLRAAETRQNLPHRQHRIEHVQCLRPEDFIRFQEFDIIASVQPIHFPSDRKMARRYWGKRNAYAYAYRSLKTAGAQLVFGSDAPVESPNPFLGIQAAINRPEELPSALPDNWPTSQSLELGAVLDAYTLNPTRIAGIDYVGRLAIGQLANLITLPANPFNLETAEIGALKPLHTFARGKLVYSA